MTGERFRSGCVRWWRLSKTWRPERVDAAVYASAGVFALCTAKFSGILLYRQWGEMAAIAYALAALASEIHWRRHREPPVGRWTRSRAAILLLVFVGATLIPLTAEVAWSANGAPGLHAQPEVTVVEAAAHRAYEGQDPYLAPPPGKKVLAAPPGEPVYEAYFPYLPGMVTFGLASSTNAPRQLTDARVFFILLTILASALALGLCRTGAESRVRALQLLAVLPTAALPLATGGDDLPVIALMALGLVMLQRRWPLAAGLVLGLASSLKFTAWPLLAFALFACYDKYGKRAIGRYSLAATAVLVPAVLPAIVANPIAFVDNVIRFPLGLAGVSSPAASPLPGHLFVTAFPTLRHLYTFAVVALGILVLAHVLVRHPPVSAAAAARLTAWAMLAAIMLAPATRFGYLIYPIDLLAWSFVLIEPGKTQQAAEGSLELSTACQSGSGTS